MHKKSLLKQPTSPGFTLIEVVIVIAILGILAGIAIPRFLDANASAKGAKLVADLRTIDSAATIYTAQNGQYPAAITAANPSNDDGFITKYLADWPVPDVGTFSVVQTNGAAKTYKDITADYYTLTSDGRANYNGHPVEWYLNGGSTDYTDNNLIKAIATVNKYLSEHKGYVSGVTLNDQLTNMAVDASILNAAGYTGGALYWHTDTYTPYYFATTYNNSDNSGAQWVANMVAVNGTLYYIPKATQKGNYSASGTGSAADRMQAGLEAMVAAGTATRLGTIATQ